MTVRLLLIGVPASEFRLAASMARDAGAQVTMVDGPADAMEVMRTTGAHLVLIDVDADVAGFLADLRAERILSPVIACGIDAPAARAVAAIRAGARDYLPLPPDRTLIAAVILTAAADVREALIGGDPAFVRATAYAFAMAKARAPVLIGGERGTGKEATARAIHHASGRSGRFVVVECAGVAPEVLESEIFGHDAGAFAGAVARRLGAIERAAHGTVLLRDIECLPATLQARLFELVRDQTVRRLGGAEPVPVTARFLASSAADLPRRVGDGQFRADLLSRLSLVHVVLPPLRDRPRDVAPLARHLAARHAAANVLPDRPVADAAIALLQGYGWPGNVAELDATLHRAVLLAQGETIEPGDLVLLDGTRLDSRPSASGALEVGDLVGRTVEEVERELILQTLERCHGNRTSASTILGISVRTMRNKLRTFIESGISVSPAA